MFGNNTDIELPFVPGDVYITPFGGFEDADFCRGSGAYDSTDDALPALPAAGDWCSVLNALVRRRKGTTSTEPSSAAEGTGAATGTTGGSAGSAASGRGSPSLVEADRLHGCGSMSNGVEEGSCAGEEGRLTSICEEERRRAEEGVSSPRDSIPLLGDDPSQAIGGGASSEGKNDRPTEGCSNVSTCGLQNPEKRLGTVAAATPPQQDPLILPRQASPFRHACDESFYSSPEKQASSCGVSRASSSRSLLLRAADLTPGLAQESPNVFVPDRNCSGEYFGDVVPEAEEFRIQHVVIQSGDNNSSTTSSSASASSSFRNTETTSNSARTDVFVSSSYSTADVVGESLSSLVSELKSAVVQRGATTTNGVVARSLPTTARVVCRDERSRTEFPETGASPDRTEFQFLSSGDLLSLRGISALNDAPTAVVFRCTHSCLSIPMVARPLNVRPGFSEVYDKHEVEGLADWVGGCRGGNLGVEGDTRYLIRHWPVFNDVDGVIPRYFSFCSLSEQNEK